MFLFIYWWCRVDPILTSMNLYRIRTSFYRTQTHQGRMRNSVIIVTVGLLYWHLLQTFELMQKKLSARIVLNEKYYL